MNLSHRYSTRLNARMIRNILCSVAFTMFLLPVLATKSPYHMTACALLLASSIRSASTFLATPQRYRPSLKTSLGSRRLCVSSPRLQRPSKEPKNRTFFALRMSSTNFNEVVGASSPVQSALEKRLQDRFSPTYLRVINESHMHNVYVFVGFLLMLPLDMSSAGSAC
jgi:hypothetical protein